MTWLNLSPFSNLPHKIFNIPLLFSCLLNLPKRVLFDLVPHVMFITMNIIKKNESIQLEFSHFLKKHLT